MEKNSGNLNLLQERKQILMVHWIPEETKQSQSESIFWK